MLLASIGLAINITVLIIIKSIPTAAHSTGSHRRVYAIMSGLSGKIVKMRSFILLSVFLVRSRQVIMSPTSRHSQGCLAAVSSYRIDEVSRFK